MEVPAKIRSGSCQS